MSCVRSPAHTLIEGGVFGKEWRDAEKAPAVVRQVERQVSGGRD